MAIRDREGHVGVVVMSAYKNDLHIEGSEEGQRLQLAVDLLRHAQGVIVIDDLLALRAGSQGIITCEVIVRGPAEPQLQIENAQALLNSSTIGKHLHARNLEWIAVEDYGTGTVQV
jgi:hypothetical protein